MEGTLLERYCVKQHIFPLSVPKNNTWHVVFHFCLSYNIKHDVATTAVHIKRIIELLK